MKRHQTEALKEIGITHKRYYSESAGFVNNRYDRSLHPTPCWGIELYKDGTLIAIISETSSGHGGDGKHYLRLRGRSGKIPVRAHPNMPNAKTQREAVGMLVRRMYNITDAELADNRARRNPIYSRHTAMAETSRERWVRRTRESVHRALVASRVPESATSLEGNLDISDYISGLGFVDQRSSREISAALRWLVNKGYAEVVTERDKYDPPGKLYAITLSGAKECPKKEK